MREQELWAMVQRRDKQIQRLQEALRAARPLVSRLLSDWQWNKDSREGAARRGLEQIDAALAATDREVVGLENERGEV